jgi:alpha-L-rhamnosidase
MQDKDSPPVEHIRITNCTFEAGQGVVTLGSEATVVRDVVVENCKVTGAIPVVRLKLRPDTSQLYEDIHYRNITLDNSGGALFEVKPWKQFFDLQGQPPQKSTVRKVTVSDVKGTYGAFGTLEGNPGDEISDVSLENIELTLKNEKLQTKDVKNLTMKNVRINGNPVSAQ